MSVHPEPSEHSNPTSSTQQVKNTEHSPTDPPLPVVPSYSYATPTPQASSQSTSAPYPGEAHCSCPWRWEEKVETLIQVFPFRDSRGGMPDCCTWPCLCPWKCGFGAPGPYLSSCPPGRLGVIHFFRASVTWRHKLCWGCCIHLLSGGEGRRTRKSKSPLTVRLRQAWAMWDHLKQTNKQAKS